MINLEVRLFFIYARRIIGLLDRNYFIAELKGCEYIMTVPVNSERVGRLADFSRWKKNKLNGTVYYTCDIFPANMFVIIGGTNRTSKRFEWHFRIGGEKISFESNERFHTAFECYKFLVWSFERDIPRKTNDIAEYYRTKQQ